MIKIQKITQPLALSAYAPEYESESIDVWVNPTREVRRERDELLAEYRRRVGQELMADAERNRQIGAAETEAAIETVRQEIEQASAAYRQYFEDFNLRMAGWLAKVWAFDGESMFVDDILQMNELDPKLINWLSERTGELIALRANEAKNA